MRLDLSNELRNRGPGTWNETESAMLIDGFHNLRYPKDKEYITQLYMETRSADLDARLEATPRPPFFDNYMDWTAKNRAIIRKRFDALGDEKHKFTSAESLGLEWKEDFRIDAGPAPECPPYGLRKYHSKILVIIQSPYTNLNLFFPAPFGSFR